MMLKYKNYIFCLLLILFFVCDVLAMEGSEGDTDSIFHEKSSIETQGYLVLNHGGMQIPTAPKLENSEHLNDLKENDPISTAVSNNNIEVQTPTKLPLKDAKYCNDLNLNLIVSGHGSIRNTKNNPLYCNKIIMNSKISGQAAIKIFKRKNNASNLLPLTNKKTETINQNILGSGNMTIDTKSRFYDTIECNASISGSGNIYLYVSYDEIEWRKKEVSGSGKVLLNNHVIAQNQNQGNTIIINGRSYDGSSTVINNGNNSSIINSFNNNNLLFYGELRFTSLGTFLKYFFIGGIFLGIPAGLFAFKHRYYKNLSVLEFILEICKIIEK